ncbi:hypothetical protein D3C87_1536490 [compost metagenome]
MRHGAEHVEAFAVADMNRLAQQPGAPVGDVQAMTGITLGVKHVRVLAQTPDLREAIGGDADHATPLVFDARVRQLREDLEHLRTHVSGDVRRIAPGIMAGAAEQQAPVCREPVVIQADFLVAQRQVLRDQLPGRVFRQGFGGNDVAAGRKHFAAEFRFEFFQVRITGQHQTAGANRAPGTTHLHGTAVDQLQHRALLEDLHAKGLRELRFTQHQIHRVQMT